MASRWSAGRRRALTLRGRAPRDPHPPLSLGSRKLGVMTPADRKAGEGSLASSLAPPGAPSPRERGEGNRDAGHPGPEQQRTGAAERWLNRKCCWADKRNVIPSRLRGGWLARR